MSLKKGILCTDRSPHTEHSSKVRYLGTHTQPLAVFSSSLLLPRQSPSSPRRRHRHAAIATPSSPRRHRRATVIATVIATAVIATAVTTMGKALPRHQLMHTKTDQTD